MLSPKALSPYRLSKMEVAQTPNNAISHMFTGHESSIWIISFHLSRNLIWCACLSKVFFVKFIKYSKDGCFLDTEQLNGDINKCLYSHLWLRQISFILSLTEWVPCASWDCLGSLPHWNVIFKFFMRECREKYLEHTRRTFHVILIAKYQAVAILTMHTY